FVEIPDYIQDGAHMERVKRLGYIEVKTVDTRSDYERWKDEYYYSYYPTPSLCEVEVEVPSCVKKIFIPKTIEAISRYAFKNLKDVTFEIDEKNYNYTVKDGKIVNKNSGDVIWPFDA
ncbi:MAG: hypothetical protein J6W28_00545, partial [Clostridia bacterium]|nr:hypothetical protein [Clostridia bacterium]